MATTTIQLFVSIEAEMDNDSANVIGTDLTQHVMERLRAQQIPVSVVTAYAQHG